MLIVSWNVNSIKSRIQHVIDFLNEKKPDILLLQELKCIEDNFTFLEFESLGYNIAVLGQKTYNGVAILSKHPIDEVQKNLPNFKDEQARYIEAVISLPQQAIRVASVYAPNGQAVGSDKFAYKMSFFDALFSHMQEISKYNEKIIIAGDFNVAPEDIDVYDAAKLKNTICFHKDEQAKFNAILNLGFYDAFRIKNPNKTSFSWWDYRGSDYAQDRGLRIDHLLLSPMAADTLESSDIFAQERAKNKPSDHAPVWCILQ